MLKSKKNILLKVIDESGIERSKFRGEDSGDTPDSVFTISLIDSPLSFKVKTSEKYFEAHVIVATQNRAKYPPYRNPPGQRSYIQWSDVTKSLERWLELHAKPYLNEIATPDLWKEFNSWIPASAGSLSVKNNEPFTDSEKEAIIQRIETFRTELLEKFDDDTAQQELINRKLDFLKNETDRQRRSVWIHTAIGIFGSLMIALSTNSDATYKQWITEKSKPIMEQLIQESNQLPVSDSATSQSEPNSATPELVPAP